MQLTFRLSATVLLRTRLDAIGEAPTSTSTATDPRHPHRVDEGIRWLLRNLPYGMTTQEIKDAHAVNEFDAPLDVSGTYPMRMSAIEERRIPDDQPRHFHRFAGWTPTRSTPSTGCPATASRASAERPRRRTVRTFRKKPVDVEAVQVDGTEENAREIEKWTG